MQNKIYQYCSIFIITTLLAACASNSGRGNNKRIGSLNNKKVILSEPVIDDALERAMQSYKQFLQQVPEGEITPEAMRRLADLKLQANTGTVPESATEGRLVTETYEADVNKAPGQSKVSSDIMQSDKDLVQQNSESEKSFEQRATSISELAASAVPNLPGIDDLAEEQAIADNNAKEAIKLYLSLLEKYPLYERNDQVMYQLARAYEENLQPEKAMSVLDKLVTQYPTSVHYDEAQFRRGEIFFLRGKYFDAEKAYGQVIKFGSNSAFYDQSLFKKGWSLFKQSLFDEALDEFLTLIKIKTQQGYHLEEGGSKAEYQRVKDTLRVSSLSFSYIGDSDAVKAFFERVGHFDYEYLYYEDLAEHFLEKRRYSDASKSYVTFYELYPFHERSPVFHEKVIEVYKRGNFPKLVIESKRDYASRYRLDSEYWTYHDINKYPNILEFVKTNLVDLAKHYHALSQKSKRKKVREESYREAIIWYKAYIASFPDDKETPNMNFLLAEILFDNKAFGDAATEYEKTAYAYPIHAKSAESAYAAVLAYQENEKILQGRAKEDAHVEMIRSSLQFADTYPQHPEAPPVLTSAAQNLYDLKEFDRAILAAEQLITQHPNAKPALITSAWKIKGYASFDSGLFEQAEQAYLTVTKRLPAKDKTLVDMREQLAASIYKQGEQHIAVGQTEEAISDFLRIVEVAPNTKIRQTAEYDASAVLIGLEQWERASAVLVAFRANFPNNPLQADVTKKLALVYEKDNKLEKAAVEYEKVAATSDDPVIQREALLTAADFYEKSELYADAIRNHSRYIKLFSKPIADVMESYNSLAGLYKKTNNEKLRIKALKKIVSLDAKAGADRSARTQYLAGYASLELVEPVIQKFNDARLGEPFRKTLADKKAKMKRAETMLYKMVSYGVPEVTAASTYKIAGLYYEFSNDLLASERPKNLTAEQLEQYEFLLEEQAFPLEEKSINIHKKNIEFMQTGVYNEWVVKSLQQLAELYPARYAKVEISAKSIPSIF